MENYIEQKERERKRKYKEELNKRIGCFLIVWLVFVAFATIFVGLGTGR